MKKTRFCTLMVALLIILTLCACGTSSSEQNGIPGTYVLVNIIGNGEDLGGVNGAKLVLNEDGTGYINLGEKMGMESDAPISYDIEAGTVTDLTDSVDVPLAIDENGCVILQLGDGLSLVFAKENSELGKNLEEGLFASILSGEETDESYEEFEHVSFANELLSDDFLSASTVDYFESTLGYNLTLHIKNNSDITLYFENMSSVVNGANIYASLFDALKPEEEKDFVLTLSAQDLELYGIDEITTLTLLMNVYDVDYNEVDTISATVYPKGEKKAEAVVFDPTTAKGTVYEDEKTAMYVLGSEVTTDPFVGDAYCLRVVTVNNMDNTISFMANTAQINDVESPVAWISTILPHSYEISLMYIYEDALAAAGIDIADIEEVTSNVVCFNGMNITSQNDVHWTADFTYTVD